MTSEIVWIEFVKPLLRRATVSASPFTMSPRRPYTSTWLFTPDAGKPGGTTPSACWRMSERNR